MLIFIFRSITAVLLLGANWLACAADTASWSLKESEPGVVTATGPLRGAAVPRPGEFLLHLSDKEEYPANEVVSTAGPGPETWLVLCIDHSGSMSASMPHLKSALDAALRSALSDPATRLRVQTVAFASGVQAGDGYSTDPAHLVALVDALPSERAHDGKTRLYDALAAAMGTLQQAPDGAVKRLVVVTDGNDEGSTASAEAITHDAQARKVPLDVIAYGALAESTSPIMQSMATMSKGEYILAENPADLEQALQRLLGRRPAPTGPPPQVNVIFRYPPATNGSHVASASLVYTPAGQSATRHELQLGSPITAPAAAPAGDGGSTDTGPGLAQVAALTAAALAVVGGIVLRKRRHPEPAPIPGPDASRPVPPSPAPAPVPHPHPRRSTVISPWFAPPGPGQPVAYLLFTNGQQQGYRYPIETERVRLGAGPGNELVLDDEYVSRVHASIHYDARNLYLQDLESANGTWLNNEQLGATAAPLAPGDQIRLGRTTLELRSA